MFALIACPACQHKFTVPEGSMGKRHNCPNCQTPFLAGKSVAEADVSMKLQPAGAPALNKTMLGETEPPIKYNCPRCKKALESPAIEALTKKPCPSCGQRLQVPAAPVSKGPVAGINKTMLVTDDSTGQTKPDTVVAGQTGSPPVASGWAAISGKVYTIAAIAGGLFFLFSLLVCGFAISRGPKADDAALVAFQKALQDLKDEAKRKETELEYKQKLEAESTRKWDVLMAEIKAREAESKREFERRIENLTRADAAKEKEKYEQAQQKSERDKEEADRRMREEKLQTQRDLAEARRERDAANTKAATIAAQPPPAPVYHYPYYHPSRYYGGWGW